MPVNVVDVITASLNELNVIGIGTQIPGPIGDFCLQKFNRLVDNWNAKRCAVYAEQFLEFTFVPNLQPHTIGPSGTFTVDQRPVSIEGCNVVQMPGTAQEVKTPVFIRDYAWYMRVSTPLVTTTFPTDVYYEPDWPNGKLFFYCTPSQNYGCELITRTVLSQLLITDTFTMPPGYWDAMILTLAEDLATPTGRSVPPLMAAKARDARAQIFDNNDVTPRISTRDGGMPDARESESRTTFNYHDRSFGSGSRRF